MCWKNRSISKFLMSGLRQRKKKSEAEAVVRPSLSYWHDAWRRLVKNKLAMLGFFF